MPIAHGVDPDEQNIDFAIIPNLEGAGPREPGIFGEVLGDLIDGDAETGVSFHVLNLSLVTSPPSAAELESDAADQDKRFGSPNITGNVRM